MELAALIDGLSNPAAYPQAAGEVDVRQTHISAVFLVGAHAYKIKKPVNLRFLDFRTLEQRRHFCEEEVRLNRRLAPDVYLGVVPVMHTAHGVRMEGDLSPVSPLRLGEGGKGGEVIEWAVKMERLPEEATLQRRLLRGEIDSEAVKALARRIAAFHAEAETNERIASFGRFEVVACNARENFEQARPHAGVTISQPVFGRIEELTESVLDRLQPLIEARAARGVPRDTHGDLHLDHVYLFPDRKPPGDLVIVDCIEFNERFRFADPVSDTAFLHMDLLFHHRIDLARAFAEAYFDAAGDWEGRALLPLYTAYRAAVRGKVEGFKLAEPEVPESERGRALQKARALWLLALGELEESRHKPCLVLIGGLPGTGKSTLARQLAERAGFHVIRSDVVRKKLALGAEAVESPPATRSLEEGLYAPAWSDRTYAECLHEAERLLFEGRRVLVDAGFREEQRRQPFVDAAARLCVPCVFLCCRASPDVVRRRLENRRQDASDADWEVYQLLARRREQPVPQSKLHVREIDSDQGENQNLLRGLQALRDWDLWE